MQINLRRLIVSLVIISSVVFIASKTSFALTPINTSNFGKNLIKVDPWKLRCGNNQDRAEKKMEKFEENRNKHYETYIKLKDRLAEKIQEWEDEGYDVSELKEDLAVLEEKVNEYTSDFEAYLEKLEAVKAIDCDNTETNLSDALKAAREALKEVRQDVVEIKTYYWSTIRQDIMDLKDQIISDTEE